MKENIKKEMEKKIKKALRETEKDFCSLEKEKLETINLNDSSVAKKIKKIFIHFSGIESIGVTGASKAIHLINPELFMMWDNEIRKNYHRLHKDSTSERHSYSNKPDKAAKCYLEFMKTMQEIAKCILEKKSKKELRKMHPTYLNKPQFVSTLPKMLDECNYVKFRRGINF
ncbi:MAG: hypothetical protein N3A69_16460 [Leptospiraceae bacterium]|nr:hypothetical protein [Leptospiraceae bacterium]